VTWQLTDRYLIRGFLEFENLLVDELTSFVVNDIGIKRAVFTGFLVTGDLGSTAATWQ
jgi:hypothetical protein